ncbi:Amiloride-sensitive sodium channel subunit, partial [Brachionus plicatilis]
FISCLYNLQSCDKNDWEWYYDFYYGNCYRFNTGLNSNGQKTKIKSSNYPGKFNGLMIELFVGIPNDQKTLSLTTGAHIFVDDNSFKPTFGIGFGVSPGYSTDIALERIKTKQMPKPYSECIENLGSIDSEYYRKVIRSNLTYRQSECLSSFFYFEINEKCKCSPMDNNFVVDEKNPCDTLEEQNCANIVTQELVSSNFK